LCSCGDACDLRLDSCRSRAASCRTRYATASWPSGPPPHCKIKNTSDLKKLSSNRNL
jgi:hypothetical protein